MLETNYNMIRDIMHVYYNYIMNTNNGKFSWKQV